ncbi:MAG: DUF1489 domain-containing protein [Alphaproteobacteria bacterium]|nr:DUF1489 domain-containing protein [Alphaproteobacteria bacterium]
MSLHLVKLCVGAPSVEALAASMALRAAAGTPPAHLTRSLPRRSEEILAGGSLYWVIGGRIEARQRILGLDPATRADGRPACRIGLDPAVVRVVPRAMRPFQGWRYLEAEAAPPDLDALAGGQGGELPAELVAELRALGLW